MKLTAWILAAFIVFVLAYLTFASNHRIVAVVPYCFEGAFGGFGSFKPCSEIDRYYDA